MKTILIFTGLKIVEISAILFVPYGIGLAEQCFVGRMFFYDSVATIWLCGFMCFIFLLLAIMLIILGVVIVQKNWDVANKIAKQGKKH